jgi:hypothetical protein
MANLTINEILSQQKQPCPWSKDSFKETFLKWYDKDFPQKKVHHEYMNK